MMDVPEALFMEKCVNEIAQLKAERDSFKSLLVAALYDCEGQSWMDEPDWMLAARELLR